MNDSLEIPIKPLVAVNVAIKKRRKKDEERRQLKESEKKNSAVIKIPCKGHNNKRVQCIKLTEEDLKNFNCQLQARQDRYSQDHFLSSFVKVHQPQRRRPRNCEFQNKERNFHVDYFIEKVTSGERVGVCKQLFLAASRITRKRLSNVLQNTYERIVKDSQVDEKPKRKYKKTIEREINSHNECTDQDIQNEAIISPSAEPLEKDETLVGEAIMEPSIFHVGFLELCRICLQSEADTNSISIFDLNSEGQSYADQLENCLGIKILHGAELPQNICKKCVERIENASILKNDSLKSQRTMEEYLSASKTLPNEVEYEELVIEEVADIKDDNLIEKEQICPKTNKITTETAKTMTPIKCFICNIDFEGITPESHFEEFHKEIKYQKCSECHFSTHYPWYLNLHLQIHSQAFRLCENCGKVVKSTSFFSHVGHCTRNKEGMRRFQCSYCSNRYHKAYLLKVHLRNHTGEKPYECVNCDEKFSKRVLLRKHNMLSHGEEPKFRCEYCQKGFIARHRMLSHQKFCIKTNGCVNYE